MSVSFELIESHKIAIKIDSRHLMNIPRPDVDEIKSERTLPGDRWEDNTLYSPTSQEIIDAIKCRPNNYLSFPDNGSDSFHESMLIYYPDYDKYRYIIGDKDNELYEMELVDLSEEEVKSLFDCVCRDPNAKQLSLEEFNEKYDNF